MLRENVQGLVSGNFARDDAHLNLILGETLRLSNLVDEMRMLALAESGGLILQREVANLDVLVRDTVELYHRDASARNVGLHAVLPPETLSSNVDPARIQQALGNLIQDALRANLKSDIRVELSRAELDAGQLPQARIEVAYRAVVIAPDHIKGYFDRFYQQDLALDSTADSGLGLAISKLLIQAQGGTLTVTSDARSGTQIRFTLPLESQT
jgi:signal transduction histidine kinase